MAKRRGEASINEQLDLRVWFRNDSDGTAFDPVSITQVEILDEDASTVLETIASGSVVKLGVGNYRVITSSSWNTASKTVYDKWYFQRIAAGIVYTSIQSTFIFSETVPVTSTDRYSTVSQLRSNVPRITVDVMETEDVIDKINQADSILEQDLANVVDFTSMPSITDDPATPNYINLLSQYKTAEMCLVSRYGAKRRVEEQSDRQYWERMYNELLQKILAGGVDLGDYSAGTSTFDYNTKEDVPPALGMGEYGGHIDESDLETQRENYGND